MPACGGCPEVPFCMCHNCILTLKTQTNWRSRLLPAYLLRTVPRPVNGDPVGLIQVEWSLFRYLETKARSGRVACRLGGEKASSHKAGKDKFNNLDA